MKLYLAHPTHSRKKVRELELKIEEKFGIELVNPFYDINAKEVSFVDKGEWNPFDIRVPVSVVDTDINGIDECNGVLAIIDNNIAMGLFMEIFYAKEHYKPVIAICTNQKLQTHPWLRYCADKIFCSYNEFEEYWFNQKSYDIKIAICGEKRHGKDVIAKYLVDNYGFKQFAFADEIKRTIKNIYGFSYNRIENKDNYMRSLLQKTGDNLRQNNKEIFINSLFLKINNYQYVLPAEYSKIVISDVRLLREAQEVERNGFKIWKIKRDILESNDGHQTETEVKQIVPYLIIYNNKTIESLYETVDKLIKEKRV